MAKDTSLVVRIPGALNEELSRYIFYLQDKGVSRSKAELVIYLCKLGLIEEMKALEGDVSNFGEGNGG